MLYNLVRSRVLPLKYIYFSILINIPKCEVYNVRYLGRSKLNTLRDRPFFPDTKKVKKSEIISDSNLGINFIFHGPGILSRTISFARQAA
jgi:hypothetical protein